uniref:cystathionine gamma-lyase n=1 Tax=Strigamia maritima TaxID=126957 RepID=T1JND1_STRMM
MAQNSTYFVAADPKFATKAIHSGQEPEQWKSLAVVPPISMSTTFKQPAPGEHVGYEYARSGNPTRNCLEQCLAALDNACYGLTFASGLAATDCICRLLKSGDHLISMDDVYGGTNRYFKQILSKYKIKTSFVDCTDTANVEKEIRENTRMIWVETPTNPTLRLVNIENLAKLAHSRDNIILVVDNTFMSSYFQQPLALGADICFYSLTKYMNGHSDVVMGAITTNDKEIQEELKFLQNAIGSIPSPFDCYLVNRGLKTLHLRMREHMTNSMEVAKFLENHPLVDSVLYPGLESHPQHELAKQQCSGFTGMVSFYISGGLEEARIFLKSLKVFTLAESLGGYESLAEHPAIMTHASVPADERKALKIGDNLIRLSVGLESIADIISDLDQALKKSENSGKCVAF